MVLMQEAGVGLPPPSVVVATDWRAGLERLFREVLGVYEAHPWLLDIAIEGIPNTPNNLAWLDSGLQILEDTPLDLHERVATFLAVSGQARWQGIIERGYRQRAEQSGTTPSENDLSDAHILDGLVTEDAYPALFAAIQGGVFTEEQGNPFEFGLARLLDGVEKYMESKRAGGLPAR